MQKVFMSVPPSFHMCCMRNGYILSRYGRSSLLYGEATSVDDCKYVCLLNVKNISLVDDTIR